MSKVKVPLIAILVVSLALFLSGCDIVDPEIPDDGSDDNGSEDDVTDESYFEFDENTNTITGYDEDGPKDVVIPSQIDDVDVEVIGEEAFNRIYHFDSVEIPDSVTLVERKAFRASFSLDGPNTIDIGNSVEEIRERGFQSTYLTEIDIPDSVTVIGGGAFNSNKLTTVEIGGGVTIDDDTFDGNFKEVYENNNKSSGVYKRDDTDSDWEKTS